MDNQLVYYYPLGHEAHYEPGHPERPERIEAVRSALREAGWWDPFPKLEPLELPEGLLERIHTREYLDKLYDSCKIEFLY